jgi:hypothetical protein
VQNLRDIPIKRELYSSLRIATFFSIKVLDAEPLRCTGKKEPQKMLPISAFSTLIIAEINFPRAIAFKLSLAILCNLGCS